MQKKLFISMFFSLLFVMSLFVSCSDATKKQISLDSDVTQDIAVVDDDNDNDCDVIQDNDTGSGGDLDVERVDEVDNEINDADQLVVIHSANGVRTTAGGGRAASENYRFNLSVGVPLSGGKIESKNYKMTVIFK